MLSRFVFSLFVVAMSFSAHAVEVVSKVDANYEKSPEYVKLNSEVKQKLNIPFYFNIPVQAFAPLAPEILKQRTSNKANPAIVFDYRESDPSAPIQNQLGLRLIILNGGVSRVENSNALAESGLIKTGDLILSFRPEWYGTLRYSHISLGVSHAGVAYIDKADDGKDYVYNIDMPLDEEFMGANLKARMDTQHYNELTYIHVLRLKDLNDAQRENIKKWIKMILAQKPYKSKLFFNTDYSAPTFQLGQPMTFVGDLGRIALGEKINKPLNVFCSEFSWTLLALRNCDPVKDASDFRSQGAPACITKTFEPMPIFGNIYDPNTQANPVIGLSDGPVVLADIAGYKGQDRINVIHQEVFAKANGKPESISSGHRAVELLLLKQDPQFYDKVEGYYDLTDLGVIPDEKKPAMLQQRLMMEQGFNASQKVNYSPTAFLMHALMPAQFNGRNLSNVKRLEYVGTIAYIKGVKSPESGKAVNAYDYIKGLPVQ
jgi:hypothetical protein